MDPARLAKIPLFAELTLDQRDVVAGACTEIQVEEGATLLKEEDFEYAMFAITAGTADVLQNGTVIRNLRQVTSSARDRRAFGRPKNGHRRLEDADAAGHRAQPRRVAAGAGGACGGCCASRENRLASSATSQRANLRRGVMRAWRRGREADAFRDFARSEFARADSDLAPTNSL